MPLTKSLTANSTIFPDFVFGISGVWTIIDGTCLGEAPVLNWSLIILGCTQFVPGIQKKKTL